MVDLIEFRAVTRDGTPGDLIGWAALDAGQVTYQGQTAQEALQGLAARYRRTDAEMFALVYANGWSNGWLTAVTP